MLRILNILTLSKGDKMYPNVEQEASGSRDWSISRGVTCATVIVVVGCSRDGKNLE